MKFIQSFVALGIRMRGLIRRGDIFVCAQIDWVAVKKRALESWMRFTRRVHAIIRWCDHHAGLGGWVGAIGAIIAVFVTWGLARSEYLRVQRLEDGRINLQISLIRRTVSEFDLTVQQYLELLKANDSEAVWYYNKHLQDPERGRMNDFVGMPITQWLSVESYDAFRRYFVETDCLVMMSVDTKPVGTVEQRKQARDNALSTLGKALDAARR
jgi:hypothetical protein